MKLLHLQQVSVVAHTPHNRLRPDLSPDLTPSPPTYITQPQPITTPHYSTPTSSITILTQTHTTSYSHPYPDILSTHLSIHLHIHPYTDTYTLTRLIVNKLLTLYILIDILTFMWYNKNNGEGPFIC